jgi:hypothetical protein
VDGRGPSVVRMKKWVTAIAVLVGLSAVGLLVYRQWDPIWTFVLSPVGGFVLKVVFSAKVLKFVVAGAVAAAAGAVAVRRKMRREAPEPELAPPVYGPPEEEPPALTPGGTETATTTECPKAPASQPI